MAAASGLPLLHRSERNPLTTSTHGTGDLIRHALDGGARTLLLGIGGSATNDGGTGMAAALGARFLDRQGEPLAPGGGALRQLHRVDLAGADPRLGSVRIRRLRCHQPPCGPTGASAIYGPQKGATPEQVGELDAEAGAVGTLSWLLNILRQQDLSSRLVCGGWTRLRPDGLLRCRTPPRCGTVAEAVHLEERLRGCMLVITGEGRLDAQTVNGKTPVGVAAVAQRLGIPTIAICGCLGEGYAAYMRRNRGHFPVAHGFFDPDNLAAGAVERVSACAEGDRAPTGAGFRVSFRVRGVSNVERT